MSLPWHTYVCLTNSILGGQYLSQKDEGSLKAFCGLQYTVVVASMFPACKHHAHKPKKQA